jgi:transaldolase
MRVIIDTAEVTDLAATGLVDGAATNPPLVAKIGAAAE